MSHFPQTGPSGVPLQPFSLTSGAPFPYINKTHYMSNQMTPYSSLQANMGYSNSQNGLNSSIMHQSFHEYPHPNPSSQKQNITLKNKGVLRNSSPN